MWVSKIFKCQEFVEQRSAPVFLHLRQLLLYPQTFPPFSSLYLTLDISTNVKKWGRKQEEVAQKQKPVKLNSFPPCLKRSHGGHDHFALGLFIAANFIYSSLSNEFPPPSISSSSSSTLHYFRVCIEQPRLNTYSTTNSAPIFTKFHTKPLWCSAEPGQPRCHTNYWLVGFL